MPQSIIIYRLEAVVLQRLLLHSRTCTCRYWRRSNFCDSVII